jgi:uncharacterized RDD family membrane protein YckC
MASRRARKTKRSRCPSCDELLESSLAEGDDPVCPACAVPLIAVEVAPLWRRAAAALVDLGILAITAGMLNWGLLAMMDLPPLVPQAEGLDAMLRLLEIEPGSVLRRLAPFFVMSGLYLGLFWGLSGRTVGAKLLGLRVVDQHGRAPRPVWVVVRVVTHFLSGIPGALGWIWAAFDAERRAWHDHLARTYVVKQR